MNRSRIEAFLKEFPFLKDWVSEGKQLEMKVKRIDSKLLSLCRQNYFEIDYGGPICVGGDEIVFFDKMGNCLGRVDFALRYRNPRFRWWKLFGEAKWLYTQPNSKIKAEQYELTQHETVGEAITRLQIGKRVYYILRIVPFDFEETVFKSLSITLYKPPKGYVLFEWLKGEPQREAKTLQKELESIDKERR